MSGIRIKQSMEPFQFIRALQFTDSFFPVGAFAYSDGLETAASKGCVRDAASLGKWMDHFVEGVFIPVEGLALVKCMRALKVGDVEKLYAIDEELTAIRPARAIRAASTGIGKRLLSVFAGISGSGQAIGLPQGNAAAAYAAVLFRCGIGERTAALAFGYNRLAGIVSAGLRLISLGQQQGQILLSEMAGRLPGAVDRILASTDEPLRTFSPLLDIHQMNHQYLYSRLFRS
jgi:urease accessory protein